MKFLKALNINILNKYVYEILNRFWKRKSLISRAGFEYKKFYLWNPTTRLHFLFKKDDITIRSLKPYNTSKDFKIVRWISTVLNSTPSTENHYNSKHRNHGRSFTLQNIQFQTLILNGFLLWARPMVEKPKALNNAPFSCSSFVVRVLCTITKKNHKSFKGS